MTRVGKRYANQLDDTIKDTPDAVILQIESKVANMDNIVESDEIDRDVRIHASMTQI